MPRKLRVEYAGALYHLLNRGDRRELIFKDDTDRQRFLDTLGECCAKTDWRVHALCLMHDRFHLLVETPRGDPSGRSWHAEEFPAAARTRKFANASLRLRLRNK